STSAASTTSASSGRSAAATAARTSASLWATSTFTRTLAYPRAGRPDPGSDGCSDTHDARGEAHRVARDAGADAQVEDTLGVALVDDDRIGAGVLDGDGEAVDDDLAAAVETRQHRAGLVRA